MESQELRDRILAQQKISGKLELDKKERNELLQKLKEFSHRHIENLSEAPTYTNKQPQVDRLKIKDAQATPLSEIMTLFEEELNQTGIRVSSGGHLGYIPGGGLFAGAAGDFLGAVINEYAGVSFASPGAVAMENELINWLKNLFSFPESAVGNLASGGSIANMIALTAARDKYKVKNQQIQKSVIYLSSQAHHSIKKALRIIGLEDVIIRHIELDENYKLKPDLLKRQIALDVSQRLNPFLIVASAGTTDVGAIDPLDEIADVAKLNNLWFHVDAAYGGFFILSSKKELFKGIEKADSLVVDPHKGFFLPYGLGVVLIKDAQAVLHSHETTGNYMQDAFHNDLIKEPSNLSPELSKHFRGARMWLPLKLHGIEPFVAAWEEKILLLEYLRKKLVEMGFKVGPEPDLSVSYFWYPFEQDTNEKNQQLLKYMHEDGRVFFSSTILRERFVIRIAILSFRTKLQTIDTALEMIGECLEKVRG